MENEKNNETDGSSFKAIPNSANSSIKKTKKTTKKSNEHGSFTVERQDSNVITKPQNTTNKRFARNIIVPFLCGALGCTAVLCTVLLIPDIKNKVFPTSTSTSEISTSNNNSTNSDGSVKQVDLQNYSNTSVYAANKILPSIVGIKVDYTVSSNFYITMGGMPQTSSATATGSGIIISDDGYILTNNHIVATSSDSYFYEVSEANKVTVKLYNDDTEYEAKIIGKDEQTDLAVIKIEKTGLAKADFADSDSIKIGEFAMAVGNPLGLDSSITCGVVSAVNRDVKDENGKTFKLIQTDAAINSGNSGGALVNGEGKVIGVNTLKLSGTGIEGMGFAIPINSTTDIIQQLIQYSKVKRPYIGITGVDLDEATAKAYKLVVGVYIKTVENFSSAEKAGLKVGDIIIEVDGKKVTNMDELNNIKNSKNINDEIKLKINRDGEEKELTLKLGEQP